MSGQPRPELSVVLPMYNEEGVAVLALAEVRQQLSQVSTSFEILCVDDGSVDGTLAAVMAGTDRSAYRLSVLAVQMTTMTNSVLRVLRRIIIESFKCTKIGRPRGKPSTVHAVF